MACKPTSIDPSCTISSAIKRIIMSPSHCICGNLSKKPAMMFAANAIKAIDIANQIESKAMFPCDAHATARTLSKLMDRSAIIMVKIALETVTFTRLLSREFHSDCIRISL